MRFVVGLAVVLFSLCAVAQPSQNPNVGAPYVVTAAGPISITGTTTETNVAILKIPANTIGKNGSFEIYTLWSYSNSANNKTMIARYSPLAGAISGGGFGGNIVATTTASSQALLIVRNNNATNNQTNWTASAITPFGSAGANVATTGSVDTTVDSYLNINGVLAVGTDTLTLQHAYLVVYPAQ